MRKGHLNILGRKQPSLFDTNVKLKEMDNMELVLDSSAIPESGTAKVRSRPTVNYFNSSTSSFDSGHGFAVPTPKVPVLPSFNKPTTNGTDGAERLSNGGVISVPDSVEGEILIPPPPSTAPPPPPPQFIPPSPKFTPAPPGRFGDLDTSPDLSSLQPPPMPPPKPPSQTGIEDDFSFVKPPPMAPPKPPSDTSSLNSFVSGSTAPIQDIPECPQFIPPLPPTEKQSTLPRALKAPPQKPMRMSSIPNLDIPSHIPFPPSQVSTPSSFNPQNTAKLYNVPKTTLLGGQIDREKRTQPILLLEDSSGNAVQVHVNEKAAASARGVGPAQATVPPVKPARRHSSGNQLENDISNDQDNLQTTIPDQPSKPNGEISGVPALVGTPVGVEKPSTLQTEKVSITSAALGGISKSQEPPPSRGRTYSPLLSHKLLNLKATEGSGSKESASPMALLMAAKQRDKHRTSLSRENSDKRDSRAESPSSAIQHSDSKPNSFTIIPKPISSVLPSSQEILKTEPKPITSAALLSSIQSPIKPQSPKIPRLKPGQSLPPSSKSSHTNGFAHKKPLGGGVDLTPSVSTQRDEENGGMLVSFIPPPPEFANSDPNEENELEPPPRTPPPDPPTKSANSERHSPEPPTKSAIFSMKSPSPSPPPPPPPPPTKMAPSPPTKPKPPTPPKLPGPSIAGKPQVPVKSKLKPPSTPASPNVAANQATLLSILQKKMLEMDPKFAPVTDTESSGDDWGVAQSDEDSGIPVPSKPIPIAKASTLPNESRGLHLKELENKVAKKAQHLSTTTKSPTSNGPSSKQPYGMTFTVRPGTKQPITLVSKDDSPC